MFSWLGFLKLLLMITNEVTKIVHDKQLMDAGAAQAILEVNDAHMEKINKAIAARRNANNIDSVPISDDPDNRDNH